MAITIVTIYLLAEAVILTIVCFVGGKRNNLKDHED